MADLVIVGLLALAAFLGLRRGLIRPLFGELAFFIALALTARFHHRVDPLLPTVPVWVISSFMVLVLSLVLGVMVAPLVRIIRAVPFVAPVDRMAGILVHVLVVLVAMYLFIGAVIDFDVNVRPVLETGVITARQVADYRRALEANPATKQYVNSAQLRAAEQAADRGPLPVAAFEKLDQFLKFYRDYIREPLVNSSLAPRINSAGAVLPFVGHQRPYLVPVKEPK